MRLTLDDISGWAVRARVAATLQFDEVFIGTGWGWSASCLGG
jgi:hypothetical protein